MEFCFIKFFVMETIGYLASIFIGISLGLIGGGGSILTVPVLVYLFHIDVFLATTYSLFVVGVTSFLGSFSYIKNKLVDFRTAFVFGIPSIVGVYIARSFLLPIIPNVILTIEDFSVSKDIFIMLMFSIVMLFASFNMIIRKGEDIVSDKEFSYLWVLGQGLLVGTITGFVGAGGGFLIIPALVGMLKTPMKTAVGTSLFLISINSAFGFLTSYQHFSEINWRFLATISLVAMVGVIVGGFISKLFNASKLKTLFGWFVLIMSVFVLLNEIF